MDLKGRLITAFEASSLYIFREHISARRRILNFRRYTESNGEEHQGAKVSGETRNTIPHGQVTVKFSFLNYSFDE